MISIATFSFYRFKFRVMFNGWANFLKVFLSHQIAVGIKDGGMGSLEILNFH